MAKIEKVTVYCDGPCGGNEITVGAESTFTLRRGTDANRRVDLCNDCAGAMMEIYNKGTVVRGGRPAKRTETVQPSGEVVAPTTAATIPVETPSKGVVVDPFDEPVAPVGTGV